MKYQDLFILKNKEKKIKMLSVAVMIGALLNTNISDKNVSYLEFCTCFFQHVIYLKQIWKIW